jgi:hypothetical protein
MNRVRVAQLAVGNRGGSACPSAKGPKLRVSARTFTMTQKWALGVFGLNGITFAGKPLYGLAWAFKRYRSIGITLRARNQR